MRPYHSKYSILFAALISFFIGCVSTKPNISFLRKPHPSILNELSIKNPLLVQELGKLPEFQDGISDSETEALEILCHLHSEEPESFDKAFNEMYKIGKPEVRKYCTPLQALLWLAQGGEWDLAINAIQNYTLKLLIDVAWNDLYSLTDNGRWNDFKTVVDRLNSPELLDYYERRVIRYKYLPGYGEGPEEARRVFYNKYGHCAQITAFTVHVLNKAGYKAYRHLINHPALMSPKGNSHRVCVFIVNGKKYIMDNGRRSPYGIIRFEDYKPVVHPYLYSYYEIWDELSED